MYIMKEEVMKKLFFALAAAILVSCTAATNVLDNQSFEIVELNDTEYVSLGDKPAYILYQDGRCNASVGGNSIFADYTEGKDGALEMGVGGATRMLVPEEYREDEFIEAFNAIASFKLDGNTIVFFDKDGKKLIKAEKK